MCKSCRQLACDERCQIQVLMSGGLSIREIAGELGRSPATISREIARNRGGRGCRHRQAQARASARRHEASGVPRKLTDALWRRIRTLTADNGKEFAGHREVFAGRDAGFCFATPCHSWERGLNEHANRLVRQYFPRGTDFRQVTPEQVEDRLNRRPRKALGCRTPFEVFHEGLLST